MENYFELFGIKEGLQPDAAVVKRRYLELSREHHPDRHTGDTAQQMEVLQTAALINKAYQTLRDPDALMAYVLKLHGVLEDEEKYTLPPAFLMEMMELNEAIANAAMEPDTAAGAVHAYNDAMSEWNAAVQPLTARFDAGDRSPELLAQLKDFYFRKKYLLRLQERLSAD